MSRLALARAVAETGCDISLIYWEGAHMSRPFDTYSRYVSRSIPCGKNEKSLLDVLLRQCTYDDRKPLLIPDCDFSVSVIDSNYDVLSRHFLIPNIGGRQGAVCEFMDKHKQKQLAASVGLNVAGCSLLEVDNGSFNIPDDIIYPCFPKPLTSAVGGKGGLCRCDTREELASALDVIIRTKCPSLKVLVEEFKEIETEYALVGFSDGEEVVIPGLIEMMALSEEHKGIALQGRIIRTDGYDELVMKFKQFVLATGFKGLFDIDFYKAGGKYYFSEMNFRFGGSGGAVVKCGSNLPAMMVRCFFGEDYSGISREITSPAVFLNDRMCLEDLIRRAISSGDFFRYVRSSDVRMLPYDDDPKPFRKFNRLLLITLLKNAVKFVLR